MQVVKANPEHAMRLLKEGYRVVIFIDGIGDVAAIAVPAKGRIDLAIREWQEFDGLPEHATQHDMQANVFAGPNRTCGGGKTVAMALTAVTTKTLDGLLPSGHGPGV